MEVRSYYATTVEAAMSLARTELGPEAMLIQSNRTSPELAHLGRYEVVFAGELQAPKPAPVAARPVAPAPPVPPPAPQAEKFPFPAVRIPVRPPTIVRGSALSPEQSAALMPLNLVPPPSEFARMLQAASDAAGDSDETDLPDEYISASKTPHQTPATEQRNRIAFHCHPGLGKRGSATPIVALVGPTSSGKTTTLMKLAVSHGVLRRRAVRLVTFDPNRVASTAQLREFAQLLRLRFDEVDTAEALSELLSYSYDGLTLIDTPGFSPSENHELNILAKHLSTHHRCEVQLVLRADRRSADNLKAIERFAAFRPDRLILTALDETLGLDEIPLMLASAQIPVSFFSTGQSIPESLVEAQSPALLDLLENGVPNRARAAA